MVFGILIAVAGSVWALQGVGLILGSFMSNDPLWIWIGTGTVLVGMALLVVGLRSRPAKNP